MITTVLFDLDGTLLPMDLDLFLEHYFKLLCKKLVVHGYDPAKLTKGIQDGVVAMVSNDGAKTNEDVFWDAFCRVVGHNAKADIHLFQDFYENEFSGTRAACGFDPKAAEAVAAIKAKGLRVVLATNPLYPAIATQNRIRWAGFQPEDFELYTTYEDTYHCKPNPAYYQDVCDALGVSPEECIMVGNDAIEDTAAEKLGIQVFLLTDCLIDEKNLLQNGLDCPKGSFADLIAFLQTA